MFPPRSHHELKYRPIFVSDFRSSASPRLRGEPAFLIRDHPRQSAVNSYSIFSVSPCLRGEIVRLFTFTLSPYPYTKRPFAPGMFPPRSHHELKYHPILVYDIQSSASQPFSCLSYPRSSASIRGKFLFDF